VDFDHTRRFHRHHRGDRDSGRHFWRHDPAHRKGVAYRDRTTSQRFEPRRSRRSAAGSETRGYPAKTFERQAVEPSRGTIDRREGTTAPGVRTGPDRSPGTIQRREETTAPRVRTIPDRSSGTIQRREGTTVPQAGTRRERVQSTRGKDTPFRGIGAGSFERKASERGSISRQSESVRRPSGSVSPQIRGGGGSSGSRGSGGSGGSRGSGGSGGSRGSGRGSAR
jgi:hypothetical protein